MQHRYQDIRRAVEDAGFICRGGFRAEPADAAPERVAVVVVVGSAGPGFWQAFSRDRRNEPHPLDAWTRRALGKIARTIGRGVVFPFDGPPFPPIQRWAMRAETVHPSPIGPLIHPRYGLWHAYRGALLFTDDLDVPSRQEPEPASPCVECEGRPCLGGCPVHACSDAGYDAVNCLRHLATPGGGRCRDGGCQARLACPVGRRFAYEPAQMRFHMEAFAASGGVVSRGAVR